MSFPQILVLWLHLAFVAFTIGPVTLAIMSTPRYIRQRDVRILRYLNRITFIFALGTLGVLIAGEALASMTSVARKPWVIVAATLFIVALLLLALILRDQRKAIRALDEAAAKSAAEPTHQPAQQPAHQPVPDQPETPASQPVADQPTPTEPAAEQAPAPATAQAPAPATVTTTTASTASTATTASSATTAASTATAALHVANVERGRIAMMGGLVSLIWLVILVLMVWH